MVQFTGSYILAVLLLKQMMIQQGHASVTDERLTRHLLNSYNKHIRPIRKLGDATNVTFYLTLIQLISVTEKSEEMTTSQYITLQWEDPRLVWDPTEFDGSIQIRLPSEYFWKPDIALFNNNDGAYDTTLPVNVLVNHTGMVEWLPAAIYRSACPIKIDLFPFDWQNCTMKFKSLAYDKSELFIKSAYDKVVVDKEAYMDNGEWDIVHCPIKTNEDDKEVLYQDITLYFIIQRRPLFYIINIIVPCVSISFLSFFVYFLPCDSTEKMTMSISVLLGLTVYLLLLAKRIPDTSLGVPLIGVYLLFTMLVVSLSILFSVIVLNIYHRTLYNNFMSERTRVIFLEVLPRWLRMKQPPSCRLALLLKSEEQGTFDRPTLISAENKRSLQEHYFKVYDGLSSEESVISDRRKFPLETNQKNSNKDDSLLHHLQSESLFEASTKRRSSLTTQTPLNAQSNFKYPVRNIKGDSDIKQTCSVAKKDITGGLFMPTSFSKVSGKSCGNNNNRACRESKNLLVTSKCPDSSKVGHIPSKASSKTNITLTDSSSAAIALSSFVSLPSKASVEHDIKTRGATYSSTNIGKIHKRRRKRDNSYTSGKKDISEKVFSSSSTADSAETAYSERSDTTFKTVQDVVNEFSDELSVAACAVNFIAETLKEKDRIKVITDDWHFMAAVLDRLLFFIFLVVSLIGILYLYLKAHLNHPPSNPFKDGDPKYATCW